MLGPRTKAAARALFLLLLVGLLGLPAVGGGVATAATPTIGPAIVSPAEGETTGRSPVFRWEAVDGATQYRVQVADNSSFSGTLLLNVLTPYLAATSPKDLPVGTMFWRVAGLAGSASGPYESAKLVREAFPAPTVVRPIDDAVITYPHQAPTFEWEPLVGAKSYELQVDDASDFVGAMTYPTSSTTYTLKSPQPAGQTTYWRVRGVSATAGLTSAWSSDLGSRYTVLWEGEENSGDVAAPVLLSPADDALTPLQDVELAWEPLLGASTYQLQVSPNEQFANNITIDVLVSSTRYSPPKQLNNGGYYWRVRGRDAATVPNPSEWSLTRQFQRGWPDVPQLVTPAAASAVSVARFEWQPVEHASHYELQLSSTSTFSTGTVQSCFTNHTSWTPYDTATTSTANGQPGKCDLDDNDFGAGLTRYWRVRGIDGPAPLNVSPGTESGILGVFSVSRSFEITSPSLTAVSPQGQTVVRPVLTWTRPTYGSGPVGSARYAVRVLKADGSVADSITTSSLTWTPDADLKAEDGPFRWEVRPVDRFNVTGALAGSAIGSFSLPEAVDGSTVPGGVTADPTSGVRMPALYWDAVTGATGYRVWFKNADNGGNTYTQLTTAATKATAFTPATLLPPGNYDFYVVAEPSGAISPVDGSFTIEPGNDAEVLGPPSCSSAQTACTALTDTPELSWADDGDAGLYEVHVALDPNFTNRYRKYVTTHTTLTPRESYLDNQAGQSYYWFVRTCADSVSLCSAFESELPNDLAFQKRSPEVTGLAVDGLVAGTVADGQITFRWDDYLAANLAEGEAVAGYPSSQEAKQYRIQVSTNPGFTSFVDNVLVEQTTYTAFGKTYPEGPLYWRVQAVDGSGNSLTLSDAAMLLKRTTPLTGLHVQGDGGLPLLGWDSKPYAEQYEVEAYKNEDTTFASVNRVLTDKTKMTALSPALPLPEGRYTWRVRPLDSDDRPLQWAEGEPFTISAAVPALTAPATGKRALQGGTGVFTWEQVPGAASYQFESSTSASFAALFENVNVSAGAWAPLKSYAAGLWHWRVKVLNGSGSVLSTSLIRTFELVKPGEFVAVAPARVRAPSPLPGGSTQTVQVLGQGGVPENGVTGVAVAVTATQPSTGSFLTVWPSGTPRPGTSILNLRTGEPARGLSEMGVGADGSISVYNSGGTVLVAVDVLGYFTDGIAEAGQRYTSVPPARLLDTRGANGGHQGAMTSGETFALQVAGRGLVPAQASAVALNVTTTGGSAAGGLTVYRNGGALPAGRSVVSPAGRTVASLTIAQLDGQGKAAVHNAAGTAHAIVDVVGYWVEGAGAGSSRFVPLVPERVLDTRFGTARNALKVAVAPNSTTGVTVTGVGGVLAADVLGVAANVTSVSPTANSFLTVYPATGGTRPATSTLNMTKGITTPNLANSGVAGGRISVYNSTGTSHVLVDVTGYFVK